MPRARHRPGKLTERGCRLESFRSSTFARPLSQVPSQFLCYRRMSTPLRQEFVRYMGRRTLPALYAALAIVAVFVSWVGHTHPRVVWEVNEGTPWLYVTDGSGQPVFDSAKVLE